MSKTDILLELPKLKREERQEIWVQLNELDGPINDEWTDDDLADEEKALIETRLNDCDMNPNAFVPWEEAEARLKARVARPSLLGWVAPATRNPSLTVRPR